MDARPRSNKQKRLEKKRKLALQAVAAAQPDPRAEAVAFTARADRALKEARQRTRDLPRFLERIANREADNGPLNNEIRQLAGLFESVRRKPSRFPRNPDLSAFRRLVEVCWERTDLLRGQETWRFANALLALSAHSRSWVRQPGPWVPRSHNGSRQFDSLLRHLLALYDVPAFMNSAWLEGLTPEGVDHQRWFIHVAQGANIRTAPKLPVTLTKRQAHLYLTAPTDFDVVSALRWAQLRDLGADERLARAVAASRVGRLFIHEEFWFTVLRWLAAQPMLDAMQIGPIIDYLHNQRFVVSTPNPLAHLPGEPLLVPPQPNLSMKGRDPATLLRAVEAWHRLLGRTGAGPAVHWLSCGIPPFRHEEGEGQNRKIFTISELTCSHDLEREGHAMRHCVASYVHSCRTGRSAIWSLRVIDGTGQETRLLTIEVSLRDRQVVQARRRLNDWPGEKDLSLLSRWTGAGGPTVSRWVAR